MASIDEEEIRSKILKGLEQGKDRIPLGKLPVNPHTWQASPEDANAINDAAREIAAETFPPGGMKGVVKRAEAYSKPLGTRATMTSKGAMTFPDLASRNENVIIEVPDMKLRPFNRENLYIHPSLPTYSGKGGILMTADGNIRFTMDPRDPEKETGRRFEKHTQAMSEMFALPGEESLYQLEVCIPELGIKENALWVAPAVYIHNPENSQPSGRINGWLTLGMFTTEGRPQTMDNPKNIQMLIPQNHQIPTNRETKEGTGVFAIDLSGTFLAIQAKTGRTLITMDNPKGIEERLVESAISALSILLGSALSPTYRVDIYQHGKISTISPQEEEQNKGGLHRIAPVGDAQSFEEFIAKYTEWTTKQDKDHISHLWKMIHKAWITQDNQIASLHTAAAIEGIIRNFYFPNAAKEHSRGMVADVLTCIQNKHWIEYDITSTWNQMRDEPAHGNPSSIDAGQPSAIREMFENLTRYQHTFYVLLMQAIGFNGMYINFSNPKGLVERFQSRSKEEVKRDLPKYRNKNGKEALTTGRNVHRLAEGYIWTNTSGSKQALAIAINPMTIGLVEMKRNLAHRDENDPQPAFPDSFAIGGRKGLYSGMILQTQQRPAAEHGTGIMQVDGGEKRSIHWEHTTQIGENYCIALTADYATAHPSEQVIPTEEIEAIIQSPERRKAECDRIKFLPHPIDDMLKGKVLKIDLETKESKKHSKSGMTFVIDLDGFRKAFSEIEPYCRIPRFPD